MSSKLKSCVWVTGLSCLISWAAGLVNIAGWGNLDLPLLAMAMYATFVPGGEFGHGLRQFLGFGLLIGTLLSFVVLWLFPRTEKIRDKPLPLR